MDVNDIKDDILPLLCFFSGYCNSESLSNFYIYTYTIMTNFYNVKVFYEDILELDLTSYINNKLKILHINKLICSIYWIGHIFCVFINNW